MKHIVLLSVLLASCCMDPPPAPEPPPPPPHEPSYCQPPPYAQLNGPGFGTWTEPTCSGDIARSEFAVGNNTPLELRCAQWLPSGEVWCVDPSAPVDHIYFHDLNQGGICIEWTTTSELWFIWRSCGVKPIIVSPAVPVLGTDEGLPS